MTTHASMYDALLALEAEARALRAKLTQGAHDWSTAGWEPCAIEVPINDPWAGTGYASEQRIGMRQKRYCTLCGWRQQRQKLEWNAEPAWADAP